jgi:hypothetical protein
MRIRVRDKRLLNPRSMQHIAVQKCEPEGNSERAVLTSDRCNLSMTGRNYFAPTNESLGRRVPFSRLYSPFSALIERLDFAADSDTANIESAKWLGNICLFGFLYNERLLARAEYVNIVRDRRRYSSVCSALMMRCLSTMRVGIYYLHATCKSSLATSHVARITRLIVFLGGYRVHRFVSSFT